MKFEWDAFKNHGNYLKHSIWFEEAQTIWTDAQSIEFYDEDHSDDTEDRYLRIGTSTNSKLLLVVFCERDDGNTIRIISARKATEKERKNYESGI